MSDDAHQHDGNDHHSNDEQHHEQHHDHGDQQHGDEQYHHEQHHDEVAHDDHGHGDQHGEPHVNDGQHGVVDEHQHHDDQGHHHGEEVVADHHAEEPYPSAAAPVEQPHHDEPVAAAVSHQRQPSNTAVVVEAAALASASPAHSRNSSQQIGGAGIAVHTRLGSVDLNITSGGGSANHTRTNSTAAATAVVPSSPAKATAAVTPRGNVDIVPASPNNATSAGASPVSEPPTPDFAAANAVLQANHDATPMTPPSATAVAAAASHSRNPSVSAATIAAAPSSASHSRTPSVVPVSVAAVGTHSRTSSVSAAPSTGNHSRQPSAATIEVVATPVAPAVSGPVVGEAPSPRNNTEPIQPIDGHHSRQPSSATATAITNGSHSRTSSVAAAATESTGSRTHSRAPSTSVTATTPNDNSNSNGNGDVHGSVEVSVGGVSASLDVNISSSLFGGKKDDEPAAAAAVAIETKNDTKAADTKPVATVMLEELVEPVVAAAVAAPTEETSGHSHDGENGETAATNGDTPSEKKSARGPAKAAPKTGARATIPPKSAVRPAKRSVIATPTPRRNVRATPARTPKYPPGDINNGDEHDEENGNGNGEEKHDDEPIVERQAIGEMPRIRRTINLGVEVGETVNGSNGKPTGIRVVAVAPQEPAALAGLMRDDVIQKVRDKSTITAEAFNKIVRSFAPNTHVNFFILRKSSAQFKLELRVQQSDSIDIGFEVHEHPGNELHVSGVLEGSDAEAKGIVIGDIVRRVNGEEIIRKTMFDTSLRLVRPGDTVNFRISPINFKEPDRDVHILVAGVAGEKKYRAIPPSGVPDPRSSRFSLSSRDLDSASTATPRRPGWVGALTADHHESSKSPQQMARDERWAQLERQREERNEVMRRRLALVDERAQQAKEAEKQREIELEAKRAAAKIKREEAFRRKAELDREFKDATILKLEADRKRQTDDGLGNTGEQGENGGTGEVNIAATLTTGPDGGLQLTPSAPRKLRGEFGEPPTLEEMMSARRRKKGEVQNEIDDIEAAKLKRAAEREERKREVEKKIADRKQIEAEERERRAKEREEERNASQRARFRIARSSGGAAVVIPKPVPTQPVVSNSEKLVRPRKEGPPRGLGKKPAPKKAATPTGEEKEAVAGSALPPRKPRVPHVERPKSAVPAKRAEPKTHSAPKREPRPKSAVPAVTPAKKSSVKKVPAKVAAPAKRAAPKAKGEAKSRNVSAPSSEAVSPQGSLPPVSPVPGGAAVLEEEVIVTQPAAAAAATVLSEDIFAPIAPITREPRAASSPSAGLSLSASLGNGPLSFSAEVTTSSAASSSASAISTTAPASSPSKATVKIAAIDDGASNWSPSISPVGTPTNASATAAATTTTTATTTDAKSDAKAAPVAAATTTTAEPVATVTTSGNATPAESPIATPVSPNPPTKRFAPPIVPGAKKRVDPPVAAKPKAKVAVDASYKSGKEPIIGYQRRASAEQRQPSPERVVPHEKLFGSDEYDQQDDKDNVVTDEPTHNEATPAVATEPVAVPTPAPAPVAVVAEPEPVSTPAVPVSVAIPETTAPVAATPPTPQAAAAAGNPSGKDVHGHWKVGDLVMARWEDWNMYIAVIEEKRPTGWYVTWTEYGQSGVVTAENIEARPAGATSSVAAVTAVTGAPPATIATPVPAAAAVAAAGHGDDQPHDGADDHDDGEDVTFDDDDHPELI